MDRTLVALLLTVIGYGFAFYFLIGYPLLLWQWPRRTRPVAKDLTFSPGVTIILAVHNGAAFLKQKLESILALDYPAELREILVVSDGSTDETDAIASRFADQGVELLRVEKGGKSAALNRALARQNREVLFFTDVRQKLDRQSLRHLAANFADPAVGAVTGELKILVPEGGGEQADMDLYWRYELWVRDLHSSIDSLFNTTGCLYAMRTSLAAPMPDDTLTDDAELPLGAYLRGYRIVFDPLALAYDYPTVSGTEWKRRMRTLAGMWQVYRRHPELLILWRRMGFHFFSHKLGRVLLPWTLLLGVCGTILMPWTGVRNFLLVNEALVLLLALSDRFEGLPRGWKKLSSRARTFLMMNLAALLSVRVFWVDPRTLWVPTKVDHMAAAGQRKN